MSHVRGAPFHPQTQVNINRQDENNAKLIQVRHGLRKCVANAIRTYLDSILFLIWFFAIASGLLLHPKWGVSGHRDLRRIKVRLASVVYHE